MSRRDRADHIEQKEDLIDRMKEIVGYEPPDVRPLIRLLAHPDMIEYTTAYFNSFDKESMCLNYEAPWNCAREAEALYENIKFGWLGGAGGIGYSDAWCEPCRKRVMDT